MSSHPMKVLLAMANPRKEQNFVDNAAEETRDALEPFLLKKTVDLRSLPYADAGDLKKALALYEPHILVLVCHSDKNRYKNLVLDLQGDEKLDRQQFAELLKEHALLLQARYPNKVGSGLLGVVLDVCQSAEFGKQIKRECPSVEVVITSKKKTMLDPIDAAFWTAGFLLNVAEGGLTTTAVEAGTSRAKQRDGYQNTGDEFIVHLGGTIKLKELVHAPEASPALASLQKKLCNQYLGTNMNMFVPDDAKHLTSWQSNYVCDENLVLNLVSRIGGATGRVVLRGPAGSGKGAFCKYLATLWADPKSSYLKQFHFLVSCSLRDAAKLKSPFKILDNTILESIDISEKEKQIFILGGSSAFNILWIFDDLDEALLVKDHTEADWTRKLVTGNMPAWAKNVLVTARSGQRNFGFTGFEVVELPELTKDQQLEFVKNYYDDKNEAKKNKVLDYVRNPGRYNKHLLGRPLSLQIVCWLAPEGDVSMWSLYEQCMDAFMEINGIQMLRQRDDVSQSIVEQWSEGIKKVWVSGLTGAVEGAFKSEVQELIGKDLRKSVRAQFKTLMEEEALDDSNLPPNIRDTKHLVNTNLIEETRKKNYYKFGHPSYWEFFEVNARLHYNKSECLSYAKKFWKGKKPLLITFLSKAFPDPSLEEQLELAKLLDSVASLDEAEGLLSDVIKADAPKIVTAKAKVDLAKVYLHMNKPEAVTELLAYCSDMESLKQRSEAFQRIGRYNDAKDDLRKALEKTTANSEQHAVLTKELAWCLRKEATELSLEGKKDEADRIRSRALRFIADAEKWFRSNKPSELGTCLRHKGSILRDLGRYDDAAKAYNEAYETKVKHNPQLSPDHPVLSTITHEIGKLDFLRNNREGALLNLQKAKKSRMEWLGASNPSFGRTLHALGDVLVSDPATRDEGITLLKQAMEIYVKSEPSSSTNYKELMLSMKKSETP